MIDRIYDKQVIYLVPEVQSTVWLDKCPGGTRVILLLPWITLHLYFSTIKAAVQRTVKYNLFGGKEVNKKQCHRNWKVQWLTTYVNEKSMTKTAVIQCMLGPISNVTMS